MPCRNEAKYIRDCVASLLALDEPEGGFEIVVADGMSDDGTRDILQELGSAHRQLRVVDNPNKITPSALNEAIKAANGEIIVRIDAHSTYSKDYLVESVRALEGSGADNVGGPWIAEGKNYLQKAIATAFGSPLAMGGAKGHDIDHEGPTDTVYLGCWRKSYLTEIGMFDEELIRNQDDELNLRIIQAGGKVYQTPKIRSIYYPRSSVKQLWRQYFQYGYWKIRVMQKHGRPASVRHLVPAIFVATVVSLLIIGLLWKPALIALAGLLAIYILFLFLAAALSASKATDVLPILPFIIAVFQISYGSGTLFGFWDFVVLRKSGRFSSLTRK